MINNIEPIYLILKIILSNKALIATLDDTNQLKLDEKRELMVKACDKLHLAKKHLIQSRLDQLEQLDFGTIEDRLKFLATEHLDYESIYETENNY